MDDITTRHSEEPEINPHVAYEHGDADVFTVSKYGIALAFGILIASAAMWGLFDYFYSHANTEEAVVSPMVLQDRPKLPPEPRLQDRPKLFLRDLRESEEQFLTSYKWIDETKGVVRIPIEEAIEIVAKKGLPSRPVKGDAGLDDQGYRQIPSASSSGRTLERIK
jgi:hypothetical protein